MKILNPNSNLLDNTETAFFDTSGFVKTEKMIEDFERIDPLHIDIKRSQVEEANLLFQKTFDFYGGYAQLSANAKD